MIGSLLISCHHEKKIETVKFKSVGKILRLEQELDDVIAPHAKIELLSEDHQWTEGPIWVEEEQKLIYTDVPRQKLYQWTEKDGVRLYLDMTDSVADQLGPSALLVDQKNQLYILRYGHGQVVKMNSEIENPSIDFSLVADNYKGLRFNHTNDAAFHSNGTMVMSDPPSKNKDGLKAGLYQISPKGDVQLVTDTISSPNGVAFSPDEKTIYIANADWQNAIWIAADVDQEGRISNGRLFFDATGKAPKEKGHPDGLKVNNDGIVFATGPGGVYILSPEGKHLGTLLNDEFNTNCTLDEKEETLYITSGPKLMRVKLKG